MLLTAIIFIIITIIIIIRGSGSSITAVVVVVSYFIWKVNSQIHYLDILFSFAFSVQRL